MKSKIAEKKRCPTAGKGRGRGGSWLCRGGAGERKKEEHSRLSRSNKKDNSCCGEKKGEGGGGSPRPQAKGRERTCVPHRIPDLGFKGEEGRGKVSPGRDLGKKKTPSCQKGMGAVIFAKGKGGPDCKPEGRIRLFPGIHNTVRKKRGKRNSSAGL